MAVYLDASALLKLVVAEAESDALLRFLRRHPIRVTSALSHVEVLRAVRHVGEAAATRARRVLARVQQLRIDEEVLEAAATLDPAVLRSLDAIHAASALALAEDLAAVLTYDQRMLGALAALDLPARAPGAPYDATLRAAARRPGAATRRVPATSARGRRVAPGRR